ncbi:MAG: hypothetical protein JW984_08485 [Deltaproteobacteria bacterium]|uniref:Xylulokinase n=1 Tax=Candidatus Zymogenus saltonus TaxID=2844893 RepID=A0A9D8KDY5_9DELT|nr:hypothetical protein [Candidatus Zymogenus saltonus]
MYILSVDLGTQSIRAAVVSKDGEIKGIRQIPHDVRSPRAGWAEQRPDSWWENARDAIRGVLEETGVSPKSIAGVVSCGQMHGPVGIDGDGRVTTEWTQLWSDKRCEDQCVRVRENHDVGELAAITGNQPTAGWVAMKVGWIKEHRPDIYKKSRWFLVPKDFINFRLTNTAATDPSEASGTYLWDAKRDVYSGEMAEILGLDLEKFAPVISAHEISGTVTDSAAEETGLISGTPVICGGGDFLVSLLGLGLTGEGDAVDITGTSTLFVVKRREPIAHPFVQNLRHVAGGWAPFFMLDSGGIAMKWCRDLLSSAGNGEVDYDEMIDMARGVPPGSGGLIFYPYLFGERRRENTGAMGAFFGITHEHLASHFARAVMEGTALSIGMNLDIFKRVGIEVGRVVCAGGGTKNDLLLEIKANVFGIPLEVSDEPESTIIGSALLGGYGVGLIDDIGDAAKRIYKKCKKRKIRPNRSAAARYREIQGRFNRVYDKMVGFYENY